MMQHFHRAVNMSPTPHILVRDNTEPPFTPHLLVRGSEARDVRGWDLQHGRGVDDRGFAVHEAVGGTGVGGGRGGHYHHLYVVTLLVLLS